MDRDLVSTITFGYLEETNIKDGMSGLTWFENAVEDSWALNVLAPLTYDGFPLGIEFDEAKIAHVDTSSAHIRIP